MKAMKATAAMKVASPTKVMKAVAMKAMKATPMKAMKATPGDNKPGKLGAKDKDMKALTEGALLRVRGASDDAIERWINSLSDSKQQLLWKKYEHARKSEHTQEQYQNATQGAGQLQKKRSLLRIWLRTGSSKSQEHENLCCIMLFFFSCVFVPVHSFTSAVVTMYVALTTCTVQQGLVKVPLCF